MRIVYWARFPLAKARIVERVSAVGGHDLVVTGSLAETLAALPGAQGLVLFDAPQPEAEQVVRALATPGHELRWMHFISAGREGFEAVGLPPGVAITSAAGAVAPAVAEHAMALLLALGRRIPEVVVQTARHRWDRALASRATSLEGQTLLIVGLGHIGEEVAKRARGFGMRLLAVTRSAKPHSAVDITAGLDELHRMIASADAIVVAIALAPETRHLLDARALAACKKGALIINVARGGVIDQAALADALRSGQIGGAGLDVTDPEPLPADDPLWDCPNVLISPHFAGSGSKASVERIAASVVDNLGRLPG